MLPQESLAHRCLEIASEVTLLARSGTTVIIYLYVFTCTIVSCKYTPPPPFATLALVQNAGGGGLYAGCDNFSDYALPYGHEVIVGGGWAPSAGRHRA